jgi:hypothetical protein
MAVLDASGGVPDGEPPPPGGVPLAEPPPTLPPPPPPGPPSEPLAAAAAVASLDEVVGSSAAAETLGLVVTPPSATAPQARPAPSTPGGASPPRAGAPPMPPPHVPFLKFAMLSDAQKARLMKIFASGNTRKSRRVEPRVLRCLSQRSPLRRLALAIHFSRAFDALMTLVIIANALLLAL